MKKQFCLPCASVVVISACVVSLTTRMSFTQIQTEPLDAAKARLMNEPCDLRALGLLTYHSRVDLNSGTNPRQSLGALIRYSSQGLRCVDNSSSQQIEQSEKRRLTVLFNGGAGFAALRNKDYGVAQSYLRAAVNDAPSDLENVYPLALAYLQSTPPNSVEGLFFLARAIILTEHVPSSQAQLRVYAIRVYRNYHGSKEGWDSLLRTAKKNGVPPAGFTVAKNPFSHPIAIEVTQHGGEQN